MFLTEIDPRAAVKGSRDPLGSMTLWAHFGRHVVGNLTTQATTVRGFTTLLLGYYLAERVQEQRDAEASTLDVLLRFEQLAGFCRFAINRDGQIRGIERVRKRLGDGPRVPIGLDHDCQILSDQKTYGLWGLYTESARASGHLDRGDRRPTRDTRGSSLRSGSHPGQLLQHPALYQHAEMR